MRTIPAFGDVLNTVLDKVLDETHVPRSISIYAAGYCSLSNQGGMNQCFLHKSTSFDVAAGLRVYIAVLYALGASSSMASLVCLLQIMWKDSPRLRHWAFLFTLVATGSVIFASTISSMLGFSAYMVFSDNLPDSLLSVAIGSHFLAFTWLAVTCLTVVVFTTKLQLES